MVQVLHNFSTPHGDRIIPWYIFLEDEGLFPLIIKLTVTYPPNINSPNTHPLICFRDYN